MSPTTTGTLGGPASQPGTLVPGGGPSEPEPLAQPPVQIFSETAGQPQVRRNSRGQPSVVHVESSQ